MIFMKIWSLFFLKSLEIRNLIGIKVEFERLVNLV